jgi:PPK2 family polyphosphate:nucleotide phosphotransferase
MVLKAVASVTDNFKDFNPKTFRLKSIDPEDTWGLKEADAEDALREKVKELSDLQERLYAQKQWSLLVLFQSTDGGGKDSAIKHVLSGVNPQGVSVVKFGHPSDDDLKHDFLWRANLSLPARGMIGIFNRSYYEDVLAVRILPEELQAQNLPASLITRNIWKERFEDINSFEQHLERSGTKICKFFLQVSPEEQQARLKARLDNPEKNWKFSEKDAQSGKTWDAFQKAAEDMIRNTSEASPWKVIPANNKWMVHLVVATTLVETLGSLNLEFPTIDNRQLHTLRSLLSARARQEEREEQSRVALV